MTSDPREANRVDIALGKWLLDLPFAEEHAGNGIVLIGRPIASNLDHFHCLVGQLQLSFLLQDILEIEPVSPLELPLSEVNKGVARILVRRGAPIQDIRLSELCDPGLPQRRPFALSVRPLVITLGPRRRFRDLEREFLLTNSLTNE